MAVTYQQFEALQAALVAPEQTVEDNGRRVTYRPFKELAGMAGYAANALSAQAGDDATTQSVVASSRD
jgi:hypothetical protein